METITTRDVSDLPASERAAIEHLLGQPLASEQKVFIMAYTPGAVASVSARAEARANLERTFATQARRADELGISADEADAAVEDAMRHGRLRTE